MEPQTLLPIRLEYGRSRQIPRGRLFYFDIATVQLIKMISIKVA